MTFSYSAVWDDTVALVRGHFSLVAALAGVFIFLPALLMAYFLPLPQPSDVAQWAPLMEEHVRTNWPWILASNIVNMVGILSIMMLLFGKGGPTVGSAIAAAFAFLPFYFVAYVLSSILTGMGFVLFILPGIYLFARTALIAPAMVAENIRKPLDAIMRSFQLTAGQGWAVAGLVLSIAITGFILTFVVTIIFGSVFLLIAGQQLGSLLTLVVGAIGSAAFSALMAILFAAIYRALAGAHRP